MSTRVSDFLRSTGRILAAATALAGLTFAQQSAPKGALVLSQSGIDAISLATLNFADDGSVNGTELLQQGGPAALYAVQGAFTTSDDGSSSLVLSATSIDLTDGNGNPLTYSETLKVVALPTGSFATLRTDFGHYARGVMLPAATAFAPGEYVVNGAPIDPAATSIDLLQFAAAGTVSGQRVLNSFGNTTQTALSGSYTAMPTGFFNLVVQTSSVDADGNQRTATETYLALPTQKDIRMVRIDGGSGLLTLTK